MLKKFFITMLGAMAAFWLSLLIIAVCIGLSVSGIFSGNKTNALLNSEQILYLKLEGEIADRPGQATLADILIKDSNPAEGLSNMIRAIETARNDAAVKGIYIDCLGAQMGTASRMELQQALMRFRQSGKWVYAYADNLEQGDYIIASAANRLSLNPVGMLNLHGMSVSILFYSDVLRNLGIGIDIVKVGSYKSAVEPFIRMDMSPESRMQNTAMVNGLWSDVTATIAANRGIDTLIVRQLADSMAMTLTAADIAARGLVTATAYRSDVEKEMRRQLGLEAGADLPLVTPAEYVAYKYPDLTIENKDRKPHIAVLYACGDITEDGDEGIASSEIVPEIQRLAADNSVKGMVLRVNSPGGSAFASEQIWHAVKEFRAAGKPCYVSMADYAASGGYYISCGADRIYADATTITGSIGIFGVIPNAAELIRHKIGVGCDTVTTGPDAGFPSLLYRPTARQLQAMQTYVEHGYETFVTRVAEGRGLSTDSVMAIGGGRVWTGRQALEIGLVDRLGDLHNAISDMAGMLSIAESEYIDYPAEDQLLTTLLSMASTKANVRFFGIEIPIDASPERMTQLLRQIQPLQARMQNITIE